MKKTLIVAEFEFLQTAKRWQFLAVTLFLPLFIVFISFLSYKSGTFATNSLQEKFEKGQKIAIIDESDFFKFSKDDYFVKVKDETQVKQDFLNEKYIGLLKIPKDYMKTGVVELISQKNQVLGSSKSFKKITESFVRKQLLEAIQDEQQRKRIFNSVQFKLLIIDKKLNINNFDFHQMIVPLLFLVIFILSTSTASTFLLQSVSEEKENRTVEILLSTVNDNQLIGGKVLGLGFATLIQVLIWVLMSLVAIPALSAQMKIPIQLSLIPISHVVFGVVVLFLGFLFFAAAMIGVGAIASNYKDAQQLSSFFIIGSMLPIYVLQIILNDIHGTLSQVLYYFPITSPIVLVSRFCLGNLPLWEVIAGPLFLLVCVIVAVMLAAKSFRLGCLMYNRRPSFKEFVQHLF
ncbi:MAG: ABC transporter permease [Candidatus Cloacimonetes bacterium]|nr:ABC transporter permease [Candidatus Cloacimonadota bacterium]